VPRSFRHFADSIGNRKCICKRQPRADVLVLVPYLQRDTFGIGAIHTHCRRSLGTKLRAERLLKILGRTQPELRIPGAAAQMLVVSMSGIRLGSGESARPFKGTVCDDISEFESEMPSQSVASPWPMSAQQKFGQGATLRSGFIVLDFLPQNLTW
jgi:hypothetical protein